MLELRRIARCTTNCGGLRFDGGREIFAGEFEQREFHKYSGSVDIQLLSGSECGGGGGEIIRIALERGET